MRKFGGMRAKAGIAAGAMLLGGLGVAATASPAQASFTDCPSGSLCAFTLTNYGGTPGKVSGDNKDLLQYTKFDYANSVYNNGKSCEVQIFTKKNYEGESTVLKRKGAIPNLDTFADGKFKDGIASNKWVNCS